MDKINVAEDCSNIDDLPTLSFVFTDILKRNIKFDLNGSDYVIRDGNTCFVGIVNMDLPKKELFVLGATFIRRYLAIFDRDYMAVGLVPANHNSADEDEDKKVQEELEEKFEIKEFTFGENYLFTLVIVITITASFAYFIMNT